MNKKPLEAHNKQRGGIFSFMFQQKSTDFFCCFVFFSNLICVTIGFGVPPPHLVVVVFGEAEALKVNRELRSLGLRDAGAIRR